jgi:hypothetical protein
MDRGEYSFSFLPPFIFLFAFRFFLRKAKHKMKREISE